MRPKKTQISLRICTVWSESSLSVWWNFAALATQIAPDDDSDQTARMRRLIGIFAGRTCLKVRLLTLRFKFKSYRLSQKYPQCQQDHLEKYQHYDDDDVLQKEKKINK